MEKEGTKTYEKLSNEIIEIAQESRVRFGKVQIIDSVHKEYQEGLRERYKIERKLSPT
ncbi:MAG TPA: hypothetical protein VJ441_03935 [Dehalococcoidia bacterium]|nr:hypothetical protein [Dehalococcoidia bacterium]